MEKSFIIIKEMVHNDKILPVVLLNGEQVWEFTSKEKAESIAKTLTENSDSGWNYKVKVV
jgi:hypothetical protein